MPGQELDMVPYGEKIEHVHCMRDVRRGRSMLFYSCLKVKYCLIAAMWQTVPGCLSGSQPFPLPMPISPCVRGFEDLGMYIP